MSSSEPLLREYEFRRVRFHDDTFEPGFRRRALGRKLRDAASWTAGQARSINLLLLCLPLGAASHLLGWDARLVSTANLLAILPLSNIVSDAARSLFAPLGPLFSGLINATLGNCVELIVGFLAIQHGEIGVAQSTMLGSILSDILFVLGACLIASARATGLPKFNPAVSDALSSLMVVTVVALILPTVLYSTFTDTSDIGDKILTFSRVTSGVLLLVYLMYLYFQLKTHKDFFMDEDDDVHDERHDQRQDQDRAVPEVEVDDEVDDEPDVATTTEQHEAEDEQDEESYPGGAYMAALVLVASVASIVLCAHNFVENINEMARLAHVTKTFIAAILIPIASNAPECSEVVSASRKKRINFAIGVIVSSILQIALFVLPALVLFGWSIHQPMTLYFETSQTCVLFLSVLMVNNLLQDDHYSYFHGVMLLSIYFIIALAYYIQTDKDLSWAFLKK